MACSCHGKRGRVEQHRVAPDDQCTMCASKHLNMALTAWGEFTYEEDNRWWAAGHVRLAVEHLKHDHRDLALTLRDIATDIENAKDLTRDDIRNRLQQGLVAARELLKADHPEIAAGLDKLKAMEAE